MTLLRLLGFSFLAALCLPATAAQSVPQPKSAMHANGKHLAPPRLWVKRPPTTDQAKFLLPDNTTIIGRPHRPPVRHLVTTQCQDMNQLATHRGDDLVSYLMAQPDGECLYPLFSVPSSLAGTIYQPANMAAVANQFSVEAQRYDASNTRLVMLTLYLRAGYYLAAQGSLPAVPADIWQTLQPNLHALAQGTALFAPNAQDMTTAAEVLLLISNGHAELDFLDDMKQLVQRYTVSADNPGAATSVRESTVARGMISVFTNFFMAHGRGQSALSTDPSYSAALYQFAVNNRAGLVGTESEALLGDAARESMRFLQYPAIKSNVADEARGLLAASGMTGPGNDLWLAAAEAVRDYDNDNCASYGTCNYQNKLADAVLTHDYTCSSTIKIRSQEMTTPQFKTACQLMGQEEKYFHQMLKTNHLPVANDNNKTLEVAVFDDYDNYAKYAAAIYGIDVNNGGMYVEGNPADPHNQARFIAYEASWLRPQFVIWNLTHEYVHYLDGRFDMYGDFALSTSKPTVWWIEGLAEYLSKKNDNQPAIAAAQTGQYTLSQIFGNTYDMADYVNRAYSWGYMAVRFMFEQHRGDVDTIVGRFRQGQYDDYMAYMSRIGSNYDAPFAQWIASFNGGKPRTMPPMKP
ncbi:collagenase [Paludibacterium sp.]|uniref:collagenase n=3 Tax=Paludibacterium sp. TaxID=1917523 RepID=UPI0025FE753C|nr:collagenase [Paludibacterium sp.]